MSKEWKPGDVALLDMQRESAVAIWTGRFWAWSNGHGPYEGVSHAHESVPARPLVVIDPEDREQVERLRSLIAAQPMTQNLDRAAVTDALREFANPTPPKPDEPRGLGAVVEDAEGVRWVSWRSGLAQHDRPWQRLEMDTDDFRDYRDIAAVAVLFDGADQ